MDRPFHPNCGKLVKCDECAAYDLEQAGVFRELSPLDEEQFREWARENYIPQEPIPPFWHPVIRDECEKINKELFESIRL